MTEATTRAVLQITRAVIGASLGILILGAVHAELCKKERQQTYFQPTISTVVSTTKPALVLLPYYCLARVLTVSSALVQVAAIKMRPEFEVLTRGHCDEVVFVFKRATQFLQDTSELVQISFIAWTLTRIIDRLIPAIRLNIFKEGDERSSTLSRLMDGLCSAIKWIIWITAAFVALKAYGVDVQPLLASFGASSIILGIAAQSILSNVMAAISFYTSPCFVPGDTVQLLTQSGGMVVRGQIQVHNKTNVCSTEKIRKVPKIRFTNSTEIIAKCRLQLWRERSFGRKVCALKLIYIDVFDLGRYNHFFATKLSFLFHLCFICRRGVGVYQ